MVKRTGPTDVAVKLLIEDVKKKGLEENNKFLLDLAKRLNKPKRIKPAINLSKINRCSNENETILVPGKVLSYGNLEKKVKIAALSFSEAAKVKIKNANCEYMSIVDLLKENSKGKNVRIIA